MKTLLLLFLAIGLYAGNTRLCTDEQLLRNYKQGLKIYSSDKEVDIFTPNKSGNVENNTLSIPFVLAAKSYPSSHPSMVGYTLAYTSIDFKNNTVTVEYMVEYACDGTELSTITNSSTQKIEKGSAIDKTAKALRHLRRKGVI